MSLADEIIGLADLRQARHAHPRLAYVPAGLRGGLLPDSEGKDRCAPFYASAPLNRTIGLDLLPIIGGTCYENPEEEYVAELPYAFSCCDAIFCPRFPFHLADFLFRLPGCSLILVQVPCCRRTCSRGCTESSGSAKDAPHLQGWDGCVRAGGVQEASRGSLGRSDLKGPPACAFEGLRRCTEACTPNRHL